MSPAIRVVLASASPRRQELLAMLGVPFRVVSATVDEQPRPGEDARALTARLARVKAGAVPAERDELVLAADTVVVLDGVVFGKPADEAQARAMLRRLGGRRHEVYTAVAVRDDAGRLVERGTGTSVWLRAISDADVAAYVASEDPFDKAGGYAVQSQRFALVERLIGCYANVVGLPLCEVGAALTAFGLRTGARVLCYDVLGHDVVVPREPGRVPLCRLDRNTDRAGAQDGQWERRT